MADQPKVSLLLTLIDKITEPVQGIRGKLDSFGDGLKTLGKTIAATFTAVAVVKFFKDTVEASLESEKSISRLDAAMRVLGGSYKAVAPEVENVLQKIMKTTRFSDEDAREALTVLVTKTGDYRKSLNDLSLVAEVAAFKQISMAEAADVVARAHQGLGKDLKSFGILVTAGTDATEQLRAKLGQFAEQEGKTFGGRLQILNNQWQEFKERVGDAITGNASLGDSVGHIGELLIKLQGWVEANSDKIGQFIDGVISLGEMLGKAGGGGVSIFTKAISFLAVVWEDVSYAAEVAGVKIRETIGVVIGVIGELAQKANPLLKYFGIQLGSGMAEAGAQMVGQAKADLDLLLNNHTLKLAELQKVTVASVTSTSAALVTGTKNYVAAVQKIALTQDQVIKLLAKTAIDGLHVMNTAYTESIPDLVDQTKSLQDAIELIGEGWVHVKGKWIKGPELAALDTAAKKADDIAHAIEQTARGAIAAAEGVGAINEEAASVLNNVVSIADAIRSIGLAGNDPIKMLGGITGALGAATGLLGSIFSGESASARSFRLAIQSNVAALEDATHAIGDLTTLNTPGRKLADTQTALTTFLSNPNNALLGNPIKVVNQQASRNLNSILASMGLTQADLDEIAKANNITIRTSEGRLDFKLLQNLLDEIKNLEPTTFRKDFAGQREALGAEATLFNLTPAEQAAKLAALAGGSFGSGAIGAAFQGINFGTAGGRSQALSAIQGLFQGLPGLSAGDLGGLTGKQFLDVLTELKNLLEQANQAGEAPPLSAGLGLPGGTETGVAPGDVTHPAVSLSDLVDIQAQALTSLQAIEAVVTGSLAMASPGAGTDVVTPLGGMTVTIGTINVSAGAGTDGVQLGSDIAQALNERLAAFYRLDQLGQGSPART